MSEVQHSTREECVEAGIKAVESVADKDGGFLIVVIEQDGDKVALHRTIHELPAGATVAGVNLLRQTVIDMLFPPAIEPAQQIEPLKPADLMQKALKGGA